ncbi:MAG: hypothetical protein OXH76_22375 [Boseongicola sp.]|nr:hypothetical protein [Boseongicola sp.]
MQTSIAPVSICVELPEGFDAITEAGFTGVENSEHDFLVHDASSTEAGQLVRERGLENSLFQPFRELECMPEPRHRQLTRAASQ